MASFWHEYTHLMTDAAHIAFELTWEAVTAILALPFARLWQKRHDATHHPKEQR